MGIPGTCSDSGETSSGSFSPGVMTESQKEVCQYVYKFLTKEMTPKLTREQAIGVLVNIKHECEFNYTDIENPDGSGGYGLAQWTAERRTNLVTWCNNHGLKYNTNTLNMNFHRARYGQIPELMDSCSVLALMMQDGISLNTLNARQLSTKRREKLP